MDKLPLEITREICKYGNFTLRNGIFIKKYEGDISHMYTINFKHVYYKKYNSITIKLSRKVKIVYYFNENNNIIKYAYGYPDDYFIKSGECCYTYDENNNTWTYSSSIFVHCYDFERYYTAISLRGIPYSS